MTVDSSSVPVVLSEQDIDLFAGQHVSLRGVYEQQDVRMMPFDPDELFQGHVGIILEDDTCVFIYPPDRDEALRSKEEIDRFEHKNVQAFGLLLATNPQSGAAIKAPCLVDVSSIELADA